MSEKRRVPRLNLTHEQFRHGRTGKLFPVVDVSANGFALRVVDPRDLLLFQVGARFSGILNIQRERHEIHARVCYLGLEQAGCEFMELDLKVSAALARALDPEQLGRDLTLIPGMQFGRNERMLWYHGTSGTDALFWLDAEGQYTRATFCILGSFVQWERAGGLSTGKVHPSVERSEVRGVVRFETLQMDRDPELAPEKLAIAKKLILSSNFPHELKEWCLREFASH